MEIGKLYSIAQNVNNKELLKDNILTVASLDIDKYRSLSFEMLVLLLYTCSETSSCIWEQPIVAYGAGKMGKAFIPQISKEICVCEIWDTFSREKEIEGIKISRPQTRTYARNTVFVVFIDNNEVRSEVIQNLKDLDYCNVFYYRDYFEIIKSFKKYGSSIHNRNTEIRKMIEQLFEDYEYINNSNNAVLYNILPKIQKNNLLIIEKNNLKSEDLVRKLCKKIDFNIAECELVNAVEVFLQNNLDTVYNLAYGTEKLLQTVLSNSAKTKERPMRMANDRPYDKFAITVTLNIIIEYLFENEKIALQYASILREMSNKSIPLLATEIYFAIKSGMYEQALMLSREAMVIDPNDLLANESFYNAACTCKNNGIYVDEPIPEYDLSKHFCWSGINFVWCGGFIGESGEPDFSPCFRPLQCAAKPEGEFWTGNDWKEFRKSVTDGSFKYCQKNQCPNIVGGWLPKKSDVTEEWLNKIIEGDLSVVPPIEELHFSYDGHCNLCCPSCRVEMQTNTRQQNLLLDELYEKNLKPLMYAAKHLTLSGCGEAIISPHSKKVLQSFSREENPDLVIELRTNATSLNAVSWKTLGKGKEVIRHITASIDASTKESFEKLRYPAKWEVVLSNLDFIKSLRNNGEIDIFEFHVVIQKENVNQLCDIVKMAIEYDVDVVTYSRMINWRGMSEKEYHEVNPFWYNNELHNELLRELKELEKLREDIELEKCSWTINKKKPYINIHFVPDPNRRYDEIRLGRYKVR